MFESHGSAWVGSDLKTKKAHGTDRAGSEGVRNLTGRAGSSQEVLNKSYGPGRVRFDNLRVSRVWSGHDPRDTDHAAGQSNLILECLFAEPRAGPADPTFEELIASCPKAYLLPILERNQTTFVVGMSVADVS